MGSDYGLEINCLTCVTGSFMTSTSVMLPNCPKYSLSLSGVVCHDSPPTNSFPGDVLSWDEGVERPLPALPPVPAPPSATAAGLWLLLPQLLTGPSMFKLQTNGDGYKTLCQSPFVAD